MNPAVTAGGSYQPQTATGGSSQPQLVNWLDLTAAPPNNLGGGNNTGGESSYTGGSSLAIHDEMALDAEPRPEPVTQAEETANDQDGRTRVSAYLGPHHNSDFAESLKRREERK